MAGDQIKQESLVITKDQDRLVEFLLEMVRIYEGLTKTEDQVKQEQSAKEAFSKIPEEALKLIVPTSLSGSSKNTQPKKEYDAD